MAGAACWASCLGAHPATNIIEPMNATLNSKDTIFFILLFTSFAHGFGSFIAMRRHNWEKEAN
jgi:hypothetical protein